MSFSDNSFVCCTHIYTQSEPSEGGACQWWWRRRQPSQSTQSPPPYNPYSPLRGGAARVPPGGFFPTLHLQEPQTLCFFPKGV